MSRRFVPTALTFTALGLAAAAPGALARHGADDPAGHERHAVTHHHARHHGHARGAEDRRHGRGHDDGPNHR